MRTAICLFTRDLRVHDNPALHAAAGADRVLPLFVFDEVLLGTAFARPNRIAFLLDCLRDLRRSLGELGGGLVLRRGRCADEVARLAAEAGASEVHVAADVSAYAQAREQRLREALGGGALHVHDAAITAQPPGALTPAGNDHFAVFTPYFRRWEQAPRREVLPPPRALRTPRVRTGTLPARAELCGGELSPHLPRGGETAARERMRRWLDDGVEHYAASGDDLAADATSRLSPHLHFGCLSAVELADRAGRAGARAFVRQLAWRDFHHQVLAARPAAAHRDYRPRGNRWHDDPEAFRAWCAGRTGIPIVDAGMRQLAAEGWMHNRARLITGGFLAKTLRLDWRLGAQHFFDLLVDGDVANNDMNWQWVAGTGTDTRPGRVLNPFRQARRYDPDGGYIRRHVPELAELPTAALHDPRRIDPAERERLGYPAPLVDVEAANARFRGAP